jgi:hypothetical protein
MKIANLFGFLMTDLIWESVSQLLTVLIFNLPAMNAH